MGSSDADWSLMVHGGAGSLDLPADGAAAARFRAAIGRVLDHGRAMLGDGADAIDVVVECAVLLEDDPLFNAGRGSVLNAAGRVEMDAAVMDGRDLAAGAVAAVANLANPIRLALRVMRDTDHVLLVGEGAMRFADECGFDRVDDARFLLPERVAQLERVRAGAGPVGDQGASPQGTIGAVARDRHRNLAAATSTGGMVNKRIGRVGDSPIVGAGVYADNISCAVSATGHGEHLMRCVLAKTIADCIEWQGMDAAQATRAAMARLRRRLNGEGGAIVIDAQGNCASGYTTRHMVHGWIAHGGDSVIRF